MRRLFLRFVFSLVLVSSQSAVYAAGGGGGTPYFEIATPFVVNLADKGGIAFLQVNAQLKVKNEELKPHLHSHMPAIQHTVMMVLSEQTSSTIRSVAGKQQLREKTLKEIQSVLTEKIGDPAIEEVYFTGFIVQ